MSRYCPNCGTSLPEAAPDGLCPACLTKRGLERTDPGEATTQAAEPGPKGKSERIGPYRLLRKIGEGGMGEVWLAEQSRPVKRKVALKVIKQGLDTKQVVARFEAERQALALMSHPAIAKVFDAGTTPGGRPYFVMEYVQGLPINEHCDRHKLTTQQRLALFREVCEGVQHAHQKAVIHRDLKPSNVLVAIQDDKPVPKIIDFGVAKATAQKLTEQTLHTHVGVMIGTPAYMSPEQADLTEQDIDTRADVYSLGVVLYELLVGALPFDLRELQRAGYEAMVRKIREEEPPRPSVRLSTLGEHSAESARLRGTVPTVLRRELTGDLDWITMKALEKDRTRRYGSPNELAADLARYLSHEPVLAGPPSAAYRAKKFVRRNRLGVSFAAVVALLLVGFAVTMALQAQRIARERDRANDEAVRANREAETANRVSEFMTRLFAIPDPGESRGNEVTAREILDQGATQIERGLQDEPLIRARMLATMGTTYYNLGLYERARGLLQESLKVQEQGPAKNNPLLGRTLEQLAWLCDKTGCGDSVEPARRAVEILTSHLGPEHPDVAGAMNILATVLRAQGDEESARTLGSKALGIWNAHPEILDWRKADTLDNLGTQAWIDGDVDEALLRYDEAVELFERIWERGEYWPPAYSILYGAGLTHCDFERFDRGVELLLRDVEVLEALLGPDHLEVARALNTAAGCLLDAGRDEEAPPLVLRARAIMDRFDTFEPGMPSMSRILRRIGDLEGAYEYRRRTIIAREANPALQGTALMMMSRMEYAYLLMLLERPEEARIQYERAIDIFLRGKRRHLFDRGEAERDVDLAGLVAATGDRKNASHLFEIALAQMGNTYPDVKKTAHDDYAALLRAMGRDAEAAEHEVHAAELDASRLPAED